VMMMIMDNDEITWASLVRNISLIGILSLPKV